MNSLPYIEPDRELNLNAGLLLIILKNLATTKQGKPILNIERAQAFYFLVNNPLLINTLMKLLGKSGVKMHEFEYYNISSISSNIIPLFNADKVKTLLKYLATKGFIVVTYDEKNGFVFSLSNLGQNVADTLIEEDYFQRIRKYVEQLKSLRSLSISKFSQFINLNLNAGGINE